MVEEMRIEPTLNNQNKRKRILIQGGAGGVGSIAIQLAKLWGLYVIATASRPETVKWCKDLGADEVVDHRQSLLAQFKNRNIAPVDYTFLCFSEKPLNELSEIMNPGGVIVGINGDVGAEQVEAFRMLFLKRISLHYEMMFARPLLTWEPERQGALLAEVAKLVDTGKIKSTVYSKFSWRQIQEAQHIVADRAPIGKIVVTVD
jgi:NADPH:quinone reductase-like Zn-dependent oxidoreductase